MKRSFITVLAALILAAAMLISPVSSVLAEAELPDLRAAWDGSIATSFAGGSGTASDPYRIATTPQLAYLAKRVNSGHNYAGKYFKLTSNLLINSTTGWENWYPENGPANKWTPIGKDEDNYFAGIFDGQNHTIKGLFLDHSRTLRGIFGVTNGAVIKNLSVERSLTTGDDNTGVFAGAAADTVFISCRNAGKVYAPFSDSVGGIAGYAVGCEFRDCSNEGTMEGMSGNYLGGIAGQVRACAFTGCVNSGSFDCLNNRAIAGIVACATDGSYASGCENTGALYGEGSTYIGGIAYTFYGVICDCTNRGDITSPTSASGIVKEHECEEAPLSGCLNEGHITAPFPTGIVGGHEGAGVINCVNRGQITIIQLNGSVSEGAGIAGYSNYIAHCRNYGLIEGTAPEIGVLGAGIAAGGALIEYCENYGLMKAVMGSFGGIAVTLRDGERVTRCVNYGNVRYTGKKNDVSGAGVVSENYGTVSECVNLGSIRCGYAAGVVVYIGMEAVVCDCYNAGEVTGNYVAGIAYQGWVNVFRCYNSGAVEGNKSEDAIFLYQSHTTDAEPVNCYFLDTSCDAEEPMGIPLTDAQMRLAASYAGFDFTNVWTIAGDEDYPYAELRWAYPDDPIPEEPFLLGDVNGDGAVDSSDALLLLRASMGLAELDEAQLSAGDVNGDGAADTTDALLILRLTLGLE